MATQAELLAVLKLKDEFSGRLGKIEKSIGGFTKKQKAAERGTKGLTRGFSDLLSRVTPFNPAMLGAAGAVAAVGAAMVKAVSDTVRFGSELVDLSSKTGLTVQQLQEFKFAGDQAGVGFDQITNAVQRLGRRTAAELPETTKFLSAMGLTLDDILSRQPGEAFELVAQKIASIENPAQQAAAAMGVFGDAGLQVLPAINQGLDENIQRFRELDVAISDEAAQSAKEFGDSLTDLKARFDGVKLAIGGAVIPALEKIIAFFGDILPGVVQKSTSVLLSNLSKWAEAMAVVVSTASVLRPSLQEASDSMFDFSARLQTMADEANKAAEENFVNALNIKSSSDATQTATITTEQFSSALDKSTEAQKRSNKEITASFEGLKDLVSVMDSWIEKTDDATEAWSGLFENFDTDIPAGVAGVGDLEGATDKLGDSTRGVNSVLGDTRTIFQALPGTAGDTASKIVDSFSQVIDTFSAITGLLSGIGGLFQGLAKLGNSGGGGLLGGLVGGGGGGGAGGGLGGLLGGLGGLVPGLAIGGLAAGGVAALAGAFSREGSAETTAESLGIDFDALEQDLQNRLQSVGENVGDFATGIQQNIGDVVSSLLDKGAINIDDALGKITDTLSFVERGQIDTADASKIVESAISQISGRLNTLGPEGQAQLERLIGAAQAFDVSLAGVEAQLQAVRAAATSIPPISTSVPSVGPPVGGGSLPVTPVQTGFRGEVRGPRLFFVEPGVRERVDIGPPGDSGGGEGSRELAAMAGYISRGQLSRDIARAVRDEMRRS